MPATQLEALQYDSTVFTLFGGRETYLKSIADLVEFAEVRPEENTLELCCGTGLATEQLLRKTGKITAVELNPERMKVAQSTLPADVRLLTKNALELNPEEDGRYDLMICINGFHYFDPKSFYLLAGKMLNQKGRLVFNLKLHDYHRQRPLNFILAKKFTAIANEIYKTRGERSRIGEVGDHSYVDSEHAEFSFPHPANMFLSRRKMSVLYYEEQGFQEYVEYWKRLIYPLIGIKNPDWPIQYWPRGEAWTHHLLEEGMQQQGIYSIPQEQRIVKAELFLEAVKIA